MNVSVDLSGDLVVARAHPSVEASSWIARNGDDLRQLLATRGAILLRGFEVVDAARFRASVCRFSERFLKYTYRSTPRRDVFDGIYTSTEYPPEETIPLHNENSYARSWPMYIWFCCITPAAEGGETPLADSRRVHAAVPDEVREEFTRRRIAYVRNYGLGVDLRWQEAFQTNERNEVEAICTDAGIDWEWGADDQLQTRQVCDAAATHPLTGEAVWFNQAHLFHVSSLRREVAEGLLNLFGEGGLPRNATFADGGAIDVAMLDAVRHAYAQHEMVFQWQRGDMVLADNMLIAHGRRPFHGPRSVLVAMTDERRADHPR